MKTTFKVGDRVEAVKHSEYNNYSIGDKGTVTSPTCEKQTMVNWDTRLQCHPFNENLKLITEEPMITHEQKLQALKDSVKNWEEIVEVFGGAKVSGARERPSMDSSQCALCKLYRNSVGSLDCALCPLEECQSGGTLWSIVQTTNTNPEAYTASKAMLARLQELLKEEEGRKPEHDIRVGDIVYYNGRIDEGKIAIKDIGTIEKIEGKRIWRDGAWGFASDYTLIHRPTTCDKKNCEK